MNIDKPRPSLVPSSERPIPDEDYLSPLVMKRFTPFRRQQLLVSSKVAFSITDWRSEPASGSVKSIDMVSPAQIRGMKRLCWSSLPNSYNVSIQSCKDQMFPKPASAATISAAHGVWGDGKFKPPKRRGIVIPFRPAFTIASRFCLVPEAYSTRPLAQWGPSSSTPSALGAMISPVISPVISRLYRKSPLHRQNQRSIIELVFISVVAFFQFADTFHHRIVQVILEFRYFCIKSLPLLYCSFIILNHFRNNFFHGSVDYIVGNRVDRSIGSLLTEMMIPASCIPAMCWICPEIPQAIYKFGTTVTPVWPIWRSWSQKPASTAARLAPTSAWSSLASSKQFVKVFFRSHSVTSGNHDRSAFQVMFGFSTWRSMTLLHNLFRNIFGNVVVHHFPGNLSSRIFFITPSRTVAICGRCSGWQWLQRCYHWRRDGSDTTGFRMFCHFSLSSWYRFQLMYSRQSNHWSMQKKHGTQVTADNGSAHQTDLRFFFFEQDWQDRSVGSEV